MIILLPEDVKLGCHSTDFLKYKPGKEDTWDARYPKMLGIKLSKYKANTFGMIQNAGEENDMDILHMV